MDAVYALGSGSTWNNEELRYSLRALEEFVLDIERVIVVGERPPWLINVVHIPHPDRHACKERNIMEKICRACALADLTPEFLFSNDDHLALAPQLGAELPNWRGGDLATVSEKLPRRNHYRLAVANTVTALRELGCATWNFDVHLPIVYDKQLFPAAMRAVDWEAPRGFVVKSLYANLLELPHAWMPDLKLTQRLAIEELLPILSGRSWWSHGPSALNPPLKQLLAALYPTASRFEI